MPETRNVALEKDMDAVFGVKVGGGGDDEEDEMEVEETTALLGGERVGSRRTSLGTYT